MKNVLQSWESWLEPYGFRYLPPSSNEAPMGSFVKDQGLIRQEFWVLAQQTRGRGFQRNWIYRVNLAICILDQHAPSPIYGVVLHGILGEQGPMCALGGKEGVWSDPSRMQHVLQDKGLPWLAKHNDCVWLLKSMHFGLANNCSVETLSFAVPGAENAILGPCKNIYLKYISLLYQELGCADLAREYGQRWMGTVMDRSMPYEPERTLRQLSLIMPSSSLLRPQVLRHRVRSRRMLNN